MRRREFLGVTAASLAGKGAVQAPPNIVFILTDDLGYGDIACQNPESKIPTPNIDRLASQGVRFTDSHSPSAVCTPTRYGVLTGRYSWRSRLKSGVLEGYSLEFDRARPSHGGLRAQIARLLHRRDREMAPRPGRPGEDRFHTPSTPRSDGSWFRLRSQTSGLARHAAVSIPGKRPRGRAAHLDHAWQTGKRHFCAAARSLRASNSTRCFQP